MKKRNLVDIAKSFVNDHNNLADFKSYAYPIMVEEQNRQLLCKQYNGVVAIPKTEFKESIRTKVFQTYQKNLIQHLNVFGVRDVEVILLLDSLSPETTQLELKKIPVEERIESILSYAMEYNLDKVHIKRILSLLNDYELVHSSDDEDNDSEDFDPEYSEYEYDAKINYPSSISFVMNQFVPPFEKVLNYVVDNHPLEFLEESYSTVSYHTDGDKEYIIFG